MPLPLGPVVDTTPRPVPPHTPLQGHSVALEPLHPSHAGQLWQAAQGADETWTYLSHGPFASEAAMTQTVTELAAGKDRLYWAIRPRATGLASGFLALLDIQPKHAAVELGSIWFGPALQRSTAATEAMFLLLQLAADACGYRRLVWKCDALNAASKRAAERLGFTYEGRHRMHMVVKGRQRDTDWYSIVGDAWPTCRDALVAWLQPDNFDAEGHPRHSLASLREAVR